jgi:hypothetical protein
MGRECSTFEEEKEVFRLLEATIDEKRPLKRPRFNWVDNIKVDLGNTGWGDVDLTGLTREGFCEHGNEP